MSTHFNIPLPGRYGQVLQAGTIDLLHTQEGSMVRLRLKELLAQRGVSMGKLSRMSDISFNTIRRMCNDPNYSPTLNTLVSIARALGVTVNDLYEDLPDDPTA